MSVNFKIEFSKQYVKIILAKILFE